MWKWQFLSSNLTKTLGMYMNRFEQDFMLLKCCQFHFKCNKFPHVTYFQRDGWDLLQPLQTSRQQKLARLWETTAHYCAVTCWPSRRPQFPYIFVKTVPSIKSKCDWLIPLSLQNVSLIQLNGRRLNLASDGLPNPRDISPQR